MNLLSVLGIVLTTMLLEPPKDQGLQGKKSCKEKMVFFFSWLKTSVTDENSITRKLVPVFLLLIYTAIGGGIFYQTEKAAATRKTNCTIKGFWDAAFYAGTLYSTIGYGNVRPCTGWGMALTVPYALIGIPLTLITFDNVGHLLARAMAALLAGLGRLPKAAAKLRGCCRRGKKISAEKVIIVRERNASEDPPEKKKVHLPVGVGLLLTFVWILILALFFSLTEDWHIFTSLYFVFISVTTIGLGEPAPTKLHFAFLQIALLIIGLSLFSMVLKLVQESLESMSGSISRAIMAQYMAKLQEENATAEAGESSQDSVRRLIQKQPGGRVLSLFMGRKAESELVAQYESRARMRNAGAQASVATADAAALTHLSSEDVDAEAFFRPDDLRVRVRDRASQCHFDAAEAELLEGETDTAKVRRERLRYRVGNKDRVTAIRVGTAKTERRDSV